MSGFGGGLETRRCGSSLGPINVQRSTPNAQPSIRFDRATLCAAVKFVPSTEKETTHSFRVRCDFEVSADDQPFRSGFVLAQTISQPRVPTELIIVSRQPNRLAVWRVDGKYANIADRRGDYARVFIHYFVT